MMIQLAQAWRRVPHPRGAFAADRGPRRTLLSAGVGGWGISCAAAHDRLQAESAGNHERERFALSREYPTLPHETTARMGHPDQVILLPELT